MGEFKWVYFADWGMLLVVSKQLKHDVDHNLFGVYQYQW